LPLEDGNCNALRKSRNWGRIRCLPTLPSHASRWTAPTVNVIDPATALILIDNALNVAGNHNGGA
jgi:hypothetical protein